MTTGNLGKQSLRVFLGRSWMFLNCYSIAPGVFLDIPGVFLDCSRIVPGLFLVVPGLVP